MKKSIKTKFYRADNFFQEEVIFLPLKSSIVVTLNTIKMYYSLQDRLNNHQSIYEGNL